MTDDRRVNSATTTTACRPAPMSVAPPAQPNHQAAQATHYQATARAVSAVGVQRQTLTAAQTAQPEAVDGIDSITVKETIDNIVVKETKGGGKGTAMRPRCTRICEGGACYI